MSFSYAMKRLYSQGADGLSSTETVTDDHSLEISINVAQSVTNQAIPMTLTVANLKAVYLLCDQDITLEFNNSSVGVPQLDLKANVAYEWTSTGYLANLLTTNITNCYATTGAVGADGANLEMRFLYH